MEKYSLTTTLQDEKIIFAVSGKIDTMNAPDLHADFVIIREQYPGKKVVFDCKDLIYVSSAGLRFFLVVNKRESEKIKLINVSHDVYERFEITGFTEILEIEKGLRDFSDKEVQNLGNSGGIEIYYVGDNLLMKVYPDGTSLKAIEFERELSHAMQMNGIPTLIIFDIVTYRGKYGLLYENLKAKTVAEVIKDTPDKTKYYAMAMGHLLKKIHSFTPNMPEIPKVSELNKNLVRGMEQWLNSDEVEAMLELVNAIPERETMLYYYFNPENIFIQNEELIIINLTNIRVGNPLFDFARAHRPYKQKRPEFWKSMLYSYFGTGNIKKKEKTIEAASLLGVAFQPASYKFFRGKEMSIEKIAHSVEIARSELFPNVSQFVALFSQYH